MSYVPPALRHKEKQPQATSSTSKYRGPSRDTRSEKLYAVDDLHVHFWPLAGEIKHTYNNVEDTNKNVFALDFKDRHHGTLNASQATPEKLAYIVLFRGANPRWDSDKIIFVKTNLELLPPAPEEAKPKASPVEAATIADAPDTEIQVSEATLTPTDQAKTTPQQSSAGTVLLPSPTPLTDPIPVFAQAPGAPRSNSSRNMAFAGYYRIVRLTRCAPHSPELVRMLEQKWEPPKDRWGKPTRAKTRDSASWETSLKQEWAVVKFEKDLEATKEFGEPEIKSVERAPGSDAGGEKKSVNEMFHELRLTQGMKGTVIEGQQDAMKGAPAYV